MLFSADSRQEKLDQERARRRLLLWRRSFDEEVNSVKEQLAILTSRLNEVEALARKLSEDLAKFTDDGR